jgi:TRAP-type mannitol/chloroaromatic compound transport system permease small subunit|nr:MAG TPA: hypothetical protein [Caudoviricetes sp.]
MSKGNKFVDDFMMFLFVLYCIEACVIIIYVSLDVQKATHNNTLSTLDMTLESLIIPVLILGGFGFLVLMQKISDMFK